MYSPLPFQQKEPPSSDHALHKTRAAFMWTNILNAPFWGIYNMLPFILYKDLHATAFQIAIVIALKPVVSLFSLYWSSGINQRPDRLLSNVIWARILSHLPFLFFPWIQNSWLFVFCSGFYMMLARGVVPAWMEILKLNISGAFRQRVFAYGSIFGYLGGGIFPFAFGWLMDGYFQMWRWIFPFAALVSLLAIFFQYRIPIALGEQLEKPSSPPLPLGKRLTTPWRKTWDLLRSRPDFAQFQIGFMFAGFGLMVMQPAFPVFFVDSLHLSYTELALALAVCKGLGFALTSPLWAQGMQRWNIYRFSSFVTLLAAFFPIGILAAKSSIGWLYCAYLGYGIMQAGSELSWNLSGPIFSKHEDSSLFTSVNVVTVGVRGCVAPALGSFLCVVAGTSVVMWLGCLLCFIATFQMSYSGRKTFAHDLQ